MSAMSMKCATLILATVALILIVQFHRAIGDDEQYFAQYFKKGKPDNPHIVQRRQNPRNAYHIEQRPINISGQPRKVNRSNGAFCAYSSDCASNCCVHNRQHKVNTCQKKARKGEYCSEDQVKLNRYADYCPCEAGMGYCSRGVCTA